MIKNSIRKDISNIYHVLIPQGKWEDYLNLLDQDGHPNRKELLNLILVFAKHIETLEEAINELSSKK